jgi:hypothetical protein
MSAQEQGGARPPWRRWRFRWWWVPAYFIAYLALDAAVDMVWKWLVATGGYGLSNAVAALIGLGLSFIFFQRAQVRYRRLEIDGDPEPLPVTTDYVTMARPSVWLCWFFGILAWVLTLSLLLFAGPISAWVLGPIAGTMFLATARLEKRHAQAMDARRGQLPPAEGGQ